MGKKVKALGIMNGTSLDGVDYSLIEVDETLKHIKFIDHCHKPIPQALKAKLLKAAENQSTTFDVSKNHFELATLYKKHLKKLGTTWKWNIVGLHGQTIHHEGGRASLQIGHPAALQEVRKTPVYFDFRSADIIAGGQGAPFAPFFQQGLCRNLKDPIGFHNLGGISNLTVIHKSKVFAFDTGPANILMDAWMAHKTQRAFDRGGALARKGLPDPKLVNQFLAHPFFKQSPPKSTGREEFNLSFLKKWGGRSFAKLSLSDQLATLAELTALSIGQSYKKLKIQPNALYFYGGGIKNKYLMDRIQFWLPDVSIETTEAMGWPTQAFEASIFAYLAAARHFDRIVHDPRVTGAKSKVKLGSCYF